MASEFNLSWDSEQLSGERTDDILRVPATKEGIIVRIASSPSKIVAHWPDKAEGGKTKVLCPGAGCPLCAKGDKPNTRYQMKVIQRIPNGSDVAKILEVGTSVVQEITKFVKDADYGDPRMYDFKISKSGSGLETKYSTVAKPKKTEITAEEKAMVDALKSIEEINPIMSIEDIKKLPLKIFMDEDLSLDAPEPTADDDDDWSSI